MEGSAAWGALGPELPPLVDHHCHGVLREAPGPAGFEALLSESDRPAARGTTYFDTQAGFAVRRWCPPLLGLPAHCPPEDYLARRRELGEPETRRRLLRATGIGTYLVDTGLPGVLTGPRETADAGGGSGLEIVRLERLAERLAAEVMRGAGGASPAEAGPGASGEGAGGTRSGRGASREARRVPSGEVVPGAPGPVAGEGTGGAWPVRGAPREAVSRQGASEEAVSRPGTPRDAVSRHGASGKAVSRPGASGEAAEVWTARIAEAVREAAGSAAGFKSVAAYRHGLALAPDPPDRGEVTAAAARWLASGGRRLTDPVLLRHLLWLAVATGRPLQLHTGFGDPDLRLHQADPALVTDFLRATADTGTDVILLHGYPYHRHAAYLASVFPHAYADVGLAVSHTGPRAEEVLAEFLELAPFGKLLFSTDAHGLPERYVIGAALFRTALGGVLSGWVRSGAWSAADAGRVGALIAAGNARRVYGLGED
ncbi:amidohydrolase family protein [Streptomyces sp. NPDC003077]|uniref:amidohydrolase family protein n=1 Tax=Streptomyces sp. NPDC003077 TaxID=3154443 RepID=UPI0033AFF060